MLLRVVFTVFMENALPTGFIAPQLDFGILEACQCSAAVISLLSVLADFEGRFAA